MLCPGPLDVLIQKQIHQYERSFTGHRTLRSGRHIEYGYSKTRPLARWHLVNRDGQCRSECHQPGFRSCGYVRLAEAKVALLRLVGVLVAEPA